MEAPVIIPATAQEKVDIIQAAMMAQPQASLDVFHIFTPGIYARELHAKAGTWIVTKIHKTEHPFVISKGRVSVWTEESGIMTLKAPYTGITKPGTRRVAYVHEDLVWTTFHATTETDLDKIEAQVIEPRQVKALPEHCGREFLRNLLNEMEAK